MKQDIVKVSKFLSLVLRHDPDSIGIEIQPNGWVDVEALLDASNKNRLSISFELLSEVVSTSDKNRFSFRDDKTLIRANQGHSIDVAIEFEKKSPPAILYHGTIGECLENIRNIGLKKMQRQYVHLSNSIETAKKVGARRGSPVVLMVDSQGMSLDGYDFYISENGVWLTDSVPSKYIDE